MTFTSVRAAEGLEEAGGRIREQVQGTGLPSPRRETRALQVHDSGMEKELHAGAAGGLHGYGGPEIGKAPFEGSFSITKSNKVRARQRPGPF